MGESMRVRGYSASGITGVLAEAGAPNGSLYHHFVGGKRDVAGYSLRRMGQAYEELLTGLLADHRSLADAVESVFAAAASYMKESGWLNMCPVSTVAGEVASCELELRRVLAEIFESWTEHGVRSVQAYGLSAEAARRCTLAMIAALEGSFVLARTVRSTEPVEAAGHMVASYCATLGAVTSEL